MTKIISRLIMASVLTLALGGCDGGTITGNPLVQVNFVSYTPFSAPLSTQSAVLKAQAPSTMAVSNLVLCFKRLRFKRTSSSASGGNVDLTIGEMTIDAAGTALGFVRVPRGTYERIEFDLDSSCLSGLSVQLTNGAGSFSTNDSMTIKFDGNIQITANTIQLDMSLQAIITSLDTVTANSEIKTKAEAASGSF